MAKKMASASNIRVRVAPSPTGLLHIGTARTALFNFLFARHMGGTYVVRIEDTDKARSTKESEKDILDGLSWLGLDSDEPIIRQSERSAIYASYIQKLIDSGKAFISEEEKDGAKGSVIRFKNPGTRVTFNDLIRGDVSFDTSDLGDFVIAKSMNEPLYHLTVVIDDFETNISHVIRGEDHLSNTARQILIQEAIGAPRPIYAHLPIVLAEDRSKLSKRKHGELVSVSNYRKQGYLPEALVNFMALLGWNPGDDRELFTTKELISAFNVEKIQKAGAIFNVIKLRWVNAQYLKKLSAEGFKAQALSYVPEEYRSNPLIGTIIPVLRERTEVFSDITAQFSSGDLDFFFTDPTPAKEKLSWKGAPLTESAEHLEHAEKALAQVSKWDSESVKAALWSYAEEKGKGNVLWPLRVALSGKDKSPDPFTIAALVGKETTLRRIHNATELLKK